MKWVTRERPKTDRIACPWLIRKFIDPDAEILYVARDEVLVVAEREGAHSFDAPGAEYTHRGSKCSFETLIDEFDLGGDSLGVSRVHGRLQDLIGAEISIAVLFEHVTIDALARYLDREQPGCRTN